MDGEELVTGIDGFITDPLDADTDDDGLSDGDEGAVIPTNSIFSASIFATDPTNVDTDGDNLQDGQELGVDTGIPGDVSECTGVAYAGTDPSVFTPDECTEGATGEENTDPANMDTDGDSFLDGEEDLNANGCFDLGESNPTVGLEACETESNEDAQFAIDGRALALRDLVVTAVKVNRRAAEQVGCDPISDNRANRVTEKAFELYNEVWTLAWVSISSDNYFCDPIPLGLCENRDNSLTKSQISDRVTKIRRQVRRALDTCGLQIARGERISRRARRLRRRIVNSNVESLPENSLVCSE